MAAEASGTQQLEDGGFVRLENFSRSVDRLISGSVEVARLRWIRRR